MADSLFSALGFKKFFGISFGMVSALFLLWTLFNATSFVPEGQELKYTLAFLGYGLLGVYIHGREDLKSKLSSISFIQALPWFLGVGFGSFLFVKFFVYL